MEETFGYVMFGVVGVGVLVAIWMMFTSGSLYDEIGKGGLFKDSDAGGTTRGGGSIDLAERDADIREMLEARNARRAAAGKETVDVEAELARLTAPQLDDALIAEIREHVEARSARRVRRGHPPLDIEAEVARRVQELS